jgi:3-oxoacyl-[acyl-carrier protein] reductase
MLLNDKVVLVTGGGRNVGAGIVRSLAREGATVAINCHKSKDKAEALANQIEQQGGHAAVWCCDIRDEQVVQQMVDEIVQQFGRIDAVVNSACQNNPPAELEQSSWDDYLNEMELSVKAVLNTVRAVRPYMKKQGGGRIINIVTEQWNLALPGWGPYTAPKGAMVGLTRCLVPELGPDQITVNMIAPGWTMTEKVTPEIDTSSYVSGIPLGRMGTAEDIGNICALLISDLASYITGAYIPANGGVTRQMGS